MRDLALIPIERTRMSSRGGGGGGCIGDLKLLRDGLNKGGIKLAFTL